MKRYGAYKQTGTTWIPSIPASWKIKKVGELFSQRKEKVSDKEFAPISVTKNGILPQLESAAKTDDGDNRKKVCVGDFVINSRSDRKGSCGVSPLEGSVSLINIVLQPRSELEGRYAHYLLRSQPFSEEYYRNGRGIVADLWTTRYSEMKTILLPVPPRAEQDQIVRYLDWQMSKINRLIAAKRKQICYIEEIQNARISKLVWHGLTENPAMKPCRIPGIDSVPENWTEIKNKYLFAERVELSETGVEPLLSVSRHYGVKRQDQLKDSENYATLKPSLSLIGYKKVMKGDLVMNIMRARNGSYGISEYDGIVSPAYCIYEVKRNCNQAYLHFLLKSPQMIRVFESKSKGIAEHRRRLYAPDFLQLFSVLPPIEEQNQICAEIKRQLQGTTKSIEFLNSQIEALIDLRTRLISDVVIGQADVRGIEVPEYESSEDVVELQTEEQEEETEAES